MPDLQQRLAAALESVGVEATYSVQQWLKDGYGTKTEPLPIPELTAKMEAWLFERPERATAWIKAVSEQEAIGVECSASNAVWAMMLFMVNETARALAALAAHGKV